MDKQRSPKDFVSGALEVNLAETRQATIVIPQEQLQFLELSKSYWGIYSRTQEFLQELNHPFTNYNYVVDQYRQILLKDYWLYQKSENPAKAFELLLQIGHDLLNKPIPDDKADLLWRTLLEFAEISAQKNFLDYPVLFQAIQAIFELAFEKHHQLLVLNSGLLKKHLLPLAQQPQYQETAFTYLQRAARVNLQFWQQSTPTEQWFEKRKALFSKDYSRFLHHAGQEYFQSIGQKLDKVKSWEEIDKNIPLFNEISTHLRNQIEAFDKHIERFYFIIFLLHLPGMANVRAPLLWDLNKNLRNIRQDVPPHQFADFLDNIFELFAELKAGYMITVFDCILTLGKEVIETKERVVISFFENKLIELGFETPGDIYIQENWQLKVNPHHLKNIRVWLELIQHAPYTFRKLLSALIVNLRLGGIFIFDTDLFQRDVTHLLNSDISPLYKQIKQLTRIFPVYFNEIGAEGELREVTTVMDELSGRQDKLIHFLRKQVHIEGNNAHIDLARKILQFWHDANSAPLKEILPPDVFNTITTDSVWFQGVHQLLKQLCNYRFSSVNDLLAVAETTFYPMLEEAAHDNPDDKKRLRLLFRLYNLLREKYSFEATDMAGVLKKHPYFQEAEIDQLSLWIAEQEYMPAVEQIFRFMEKLNQVIFNPQHSEGWESIYHKRHVAFGIPSMYGQYREPKFEALGLIFRLERLANRLMEQIIYDFRTEFITARSLRTSYRILELFRRGLELDGISSQGLASNLDMLKYGLTSDSFSLDQYINLFQFMSKNVKDIISTYFFGFYDQPLRMIIPQLNRSSQTLTDKEFNQLISKQSESFYREILHASFLIQPLDNFISRMIHALRNMVDNFTPEVIRNIMSYDSALVISPLYQEKRQVDSQIFLGSKAYFQKKLLLSGFPVPPGFVLTTEVFRRQNAIRSNAPLAQEVDDLIFKHLNLLEQHCQQRFGSARKPLLLSVRSGTAISMPGAMNTFLNVGMNDQIAAGFARSSKYAWTSWDCYRRFLQSWGMAHGIDRDIFDQVMAEQKNRYGIDQKALFNPQQMQETAMRYKTLLQDSQVLFEENPRKQLLQAIRVVFDSWNSERANVYREHLQIADEWGTAVVIQKMVLGNISQKSGTGVVFTHNPMIQKPGIYLNGDFTLCSQGEDIVSGLVHALPVSILQKDLTNRINQSSLQEAFPSIFEHLNHIAQKLVEEQGFSHQEIEFTFESHKPQDLYILQVRDQETRKQEQLQVFSPQGRMKLLGRGIGGGGGALNGRLAIDMADLRLLRRKYPNESCILFRPDTVPDDIPIIFECDGLVTSRGGTTSHAAVTAARLGKVCILNTTQLVVDEKNKICHLNGQPLKPGDKLAIDGFAGNIYKGHYPTEITQIINTL